MEKINAFEAKTRFSELLRETEKGREFTILWHGREVARLLPPQQSPGEKGFQALSSEFRKIRKKIKGPLNIRELIKEGRRFEGVALGDL